MKTYTVPALSCGRCVAAITRAVEAIDPTAELEFDLARREVRIDSALPAASLEAALAEAGYAPAPAPVAATPRAGGGCCG